MKMGKSIFHKIILYGDLLSIFNGENQLFIVSVCVCVCELVKLCIDAA